MLIAQELDLLERRLLVIDRALAESDLRVKASPPHGHFSNYQRQEAEHEYRDLVYQRAKTKNRLEQLRQNVEGAGWVFRRRRPKPNAEDQKRMAALDALEQEWRESTQRSCRRAEGEGDYRTARLWRSELITAREQLARQYGFVDGAR